MASEQMTLTTLEVNLLLTVAAHMHDDDLMDEGTDQRIFDVCEKASRMKREGYVAVITGGGIDNAC